MGEYFGTPVPPQENPDDVVCTFTANVGCLTCCSAILMSWRADEKIHDCGTEIMACFRTAHGPKNAKTPGHPGFFEGMASMGLHKASDSCPQRTTLVSLVACRSDPDTPGNILFDQQVPPAHYVRSVYDED